LEFTEKIRVIEHEGKYFNIKFTREYRKILESLFQKDKFSIATDFHIRLFNDKFDYTEKELYDLLYCGIGDSNKDKLDVNKLIPEKIQDEIKLFTTLCLCFLEDMDYFELIKKHIENKEEENEKKKMK
jgi:hypothetical protein